MSFEGVSLYLLGFLTPVLLKWIVDNLVLRQKDLEDRVNEICREIQLQADRAGAYWMKPNPPVGSSETDKSIGACSAEEAKIAGADFYIGAMIAHISDEFRQFDSHLSSGELFEFSDAVQGGDFQVVNRDADPARGQRIQRAAYKLCVALRKGRRDAIFPPRILTR